jgi:REP element-mobilizing transposase RayT
MLRRFLNLPPQYFRLRQKHKGLHIYGYVIMSNHIHIIVHTEGYELSDVLRDFKKFTASSILKSIQKDSESRREWLMYLFKYYAKYESPSREHQFWQSDNHPIALWSQEVIWQKLDYIHLNPVRAGIVRQSTDYIYSSAMDYYLNKKGLLDIVLVEPIGPVKPLY